MDCRDTLNQSVSGSKPEIIIRFHPGSRPEGRSMQKLYRMIPKVDLFLQSEAMEELIQSYGRSAVTEAVRQELDSLRSQVGELVERIELEDSRAGENMTAESSYPDIDAEAYVAKLIEQLPEMVRDRLRRKKARRFGRVINATGTVLHTNLGRAPLSEAQIGRLAEKLAGYSNLEYDLEAGCRGERYSHFEDLLVHLTGAEAAVAVNNNAAAVLLVLSALAAGREVVVSRGEQIEIGGKFRIPEVIAQGGAILREVGTTNKTHREDYIQAVNENTGAILKVHTSNYRIQGFTESVPVSDLTGLGVPVIADLGSGVFVNLEELGLEHEPTVQETVRQGADLVCFSGDKLLGGPQAGIIVGRKEYIRRIKAHPLMRAVRIDKFTAAALETVLQEYTEGQEQAVREILTLRLLAQKQPKLRERAKRLRQMLPEEIPGWTLQVKDCRSEAGGGSLPGQELPSAALTLEAKEAAALLRLQEQLRLAPVPVIGYMARNCFWLDVRTVAEEELELLAEELMDILLKQSS